MEQKLIFVYNVDGGFLNSIADCAKRTFSADTYPCNLRKVTHGPLGMAGEWKRFVRKLDIKAEFLHKSSFVAKYPKTFIKNYPKNLAYPCVLKGGKDSLVVLITAEELAALKSAEELMDLVSGKLLDRKA